MHMTTWTQWCHNGKLTRSRRSPNVKRNSLSHGIAFFVTRHYHYPTCSPPQISLVNLVLFLVLCRWTALSWTQTQLFSVQRRQNDALTIMILAKGSQQGGLESQVRSQCSYHLTPPGFRGALAELLSFWPWGKPEGLLSIASVLL